MAERTDASLDVKLNGVILGHRGGTIPIPWAKAFPRPEHNKR